MSAIGGIYNLDARSVDSADLQRMGEVLAHRGPDGWGVWIDGSAGLMHRMLWTTPESLQEKLPLVKQSGDLVITADARIDNRDELFTTLDFPSRPKGEVADSELILAAYEKWGEHCPEKLLGDFAFAIWDGRKRTLFCARDHFGVKPFYYYSSGRTFIFATEIKGIFCLPAVPRQLNEIRVGDYLTLMLFDKTITFYQDILRLPPAHSMTVSCQGIRLQSYWSPDPSYELRLGSDEEYAAKFREIFTEAVRCRLRSAFPIGSMLSGGLDSSSVTCMTRKIMIENGGQRLSTFSAIFDEVKESDERSYINAVLAQGGLEPHYLYGDRLSPLTDLDRVLWHQDEPLFACNLYLNWGIYGIANQQGIRVMLDGYDGDLSVSHGVGYLRELALAGRWPTLFREVRGFTRNFNYPFWKTLWPYVQTYGVNPIISKSKLPSLAKRLRRSVLTRIRYRRHLSAQHPLSSAAVVNPAFIERIDLKARRRALAKDRFASSSLTQREEHCKDVTSGLLPTTLEVLDRAAAAFSIELRYPFWDKRLVEFCLSLPVEQKMHQGWTRMVMRRGMADILPREVQWRGGKGNLGPGFNHSLLTYEQERLQEVILKSLPLIEDYVDKSALRKAHRRFISREANNDDLLAIWNALNLVLWLKHTGLKPLHNRDLIDLTAIAQEKEIADGCPVG